MQKNKKKRADTDEDPEIRLDLAFKREKRRHRSRRRDPVKQRKKRILLSFLCLCILGICVGTAALWLHYGEKLPKLPESAETASRLEEKAERDGRIHGENDGQMTDGNASADVFLKAGDKASHQSEFSIAGLSGGEGADETDGNAGGAEFADLHTAARTSAEKQDISQAAALTKAADADDTRAVRLLFGGDVYLSSYVLEAYDRAGGVQGILDETYRAEIKAADLFIVNQEFPFSERGTPAADKSFTFRLPPERAALLKELGVDLCVLANNHVLDYGREALSDTLRTLDEVGIRYVGAGDDLTEAKQAYIAEIGGQTFGFLAASRVAPDTGWSAGADRPGVLLAYDPSALLEEVRALRQSCDHLIVYMHWGIEREEYPREEIRALAHSIADAGANLIVGAHPHVLQGVEFYQETPIIYSLGNFLFGSSIPKTMLLRAEFQPGVRAPRLEILPGTGSMGRTVALSKNAQRNLYDYYEGISRNTLINQDGSLTQVSEEVSHP